MAYELIEAKDRDKWAEALNACGQHDTYHTAGYHALHEGEAVLFVSCNVVFPMLLRGSTATSVYGYPGPTTQRRYFIQDRECWQSDLYEALWELGVTKLETRLHPIFQGPQLLCGFAKSERVGTTVAIKLDAEAKWWGMQLSKGHKADLRRVQEAEVVVVQDKEFKFMAEFRDAYYETMERVGAKEHYTFPGNYFSAIRNLPQSKLFVVLLGGAMVSAAIFLCCKGIVQYHLSGTPDKHTEAGGAKAIIAHVAEWAAGAGYQYLHLGGGLGGDPDDPLYTFKKGFSRARLPFLIARWQQ